jgi:hypothetical protein
MNSVFKNIAGTISNVFRIGMKGPSLTWGQSAPSTGTAGDLCIIVGDAPQLLQKRDTGWEDIAAPSFVFVAVTDASYACDGTEDLVLVDRAGATTIVLAEGTAGKSVVIKEGMGQTVAITVATSSGQTIDGAGNATISSPRGALRLLYGTEWHVV